MIEGTSSQDPLNNSSARNPWEAPPSVIPASEDLSNIPSNPTPQKEPFTPVLFRPPDSPAPKQSSSSNGTKSGSRFKKIIMLVAGIFVLITVIAVLASVLMPKGGMISSGGNATLAYWGLWEDENVMKPVIEQFEKENPNIKVEYKKQDPADYREKLTVRVQNGTGPDIFRFHNTWYPMLSGILMPLPKEAISRDEFEDTYFDVAKKDLIKNGEIIGVPLQTDTLALFVNTQLFDQVSTESATQVPIPKTWVEFIDAAEKLTKRGDKGAIVQSGAAIGTFDNVNHASDILSLLFVQNGVDLNNLADSKEKVADALKFYTTFALTNDNVWDQTQDNSLLAFSQGKVAMYFGYSRDYHTIKAQNPGLSIKVVPAPQLISDQKANIASYWAEGVNSQTKYPKEALIFMKFLADPKTQEILYQEASRNREFGEPYSNKNFADKLKDTQASAFVDQSSTAVSTPFVDETFDNGLNSELNNHMKEFVKSFLESNGDNEEAVGVFLDGYSQVMTKYSGR